MMNQQESMVNIGLTFLPRLGPSNFELAVALHVFIPAMLNRWPAADVFFNPPMPPSALFAEPDFPTA